MHHLWNTCSVICYDESGQPILGQNPVIRAKQLLNDVPKAKRVMVRHSDTDHDHVHIVASRVSVDGSCVDMWQSKKRSQPLLREYEKQYDLKQVQKSSDQKKGATPAEFNKTERTRTQSHKNFLQESLYDFLATIPRLKNSLNPILEPAMVRVGPCGLLLDATLFLHIASLSFAAGDLGVGLGIVALDAGFAALLSCRMLVSLVWMLFSFLLLAFWLELASGMNGHVKG